MHKLRYLSLLLVGILLLFSGTTAAAEPAEWQTWDTSTDGTRTLSETSWVMCDKAEVGWSDENPAASAGSSAENPDLDWDVTGVGSVTVHYQLDETAVPTGGAVRLFLYDKPNADTWAEAPYRMDVVPNDGEAEGILSVVTDSDKIGTIGVVYDSSGNTPGRVMFTNLQIDGVSVPFTDDCTEQPTETPTEQPTEQPAGKTSDYSCDDFADRAELNEHLQQYPGDEAELDGDGDGVLCENLEDVVVPTEIPAGSFQPTGPAPLTIIAAGFALIGAGVLFAYSMTRDRRRE